VQRCYQVSRELLKFLNEQDKLDLTRDVSVTWERIHSMGSARIASLLAAKRGVEVEASYSAGALHDFGRFVTGKQENHAENGYEPVKGFLRSLNIFSEKEIEEVALAVKNHSRKEIAGTPGEIARTATFWIAITDSSPKNPIKRFAALQNELDLAYRSKNLLPVDPRSSVCR
jgi:uncharacterized protein